MENTLKEIILNNNMSNGNENRENQFGDISGYIFNNHENISEIDDDDLDYIHNHDIKEIENGVRNENESEDDYQDRCFEMNENDYLNIDFEMNESGNESENENHENQTFGDLSGYIFNDDNDYELDDDDKKYTLDQDIKEFSIPFSNSDSDSEDDYQNPYHEWYDYYDDTGQHTPYYDEMRENFNAGERVVSESEELDSDFDFDSNEMSITAPAA